MISIQCVVTSVAGGGFVVRGWDVKEILISMLEDTERGVMIGNRGIGQESRQIEQIESEYLSANPHVSIASLPTLS